MPLGEAAAVTRSGTVSKKRERAGRRVQGGGRYTPPQSREPPVPAGFFEEGVEDRSAAFSISGVWAGEDDPDDDDRWPVIVELPRFGQWQVPQAFAFWLVDDDLVDQFDELLCARRDGGVHGDVFAAFLDGRDAPAEVREAAAGYGEFMDEHFGIP